MSGGATNDVFIVLCDWRGRKVWGSRPNPETETGDFIWSHLEAESQQIAKQSLASVVALRETQFHEVTSQRGERARVWIWPLDSPEVAACMLCMRVPIELAKLTESERLCLQLLAQGIETRVIAKQLDVSLSTVHTHMKRARSKLGLSSADELISFSARYCYPVDASLAMEIAKRGEKGG